MATIKQKEVVVQLEGGSPIKVRRMPWKAARDAIRLLAAAIAKFYAAKSLGEVTIDNGVQVKMALDGILEKLPELLESSDELVVHVVTHSTDLTADAFNELDLALAGAVIAAALEVNFDTETKNSFAGMVSVIKGLMPAGPKTS